MQTTESRLIEIDRAMFGSSQRGAVEGYQLLCWSDGVDSQTGKELCQWAPTRLVSSAADRWTVQLFYSSSGRPCISRTFLAGHEYSRRGGRNVISAFVILESEQWELHRRDALAVFNLAMALGYLRSIEGGAQNPLPKLAFPVTAPLSSEDLYELHPQAECGNFPLDEIADRLSEGDRIALVGASNPVQLVGQLVARLSREARQNFTFTTGLPLSIHRPFQLHCMDQASYTQQPALVDWLTDCVYRA
jgi:hypothetical protein